MIKEENSAELESAKIWNNVTDDSNGEVIKKQTIQTPEFGQISQKDIIHMLKDVFKAKPPKRHGNARSLIFDLKVVDKLGKIYDLDVNIKVESKPTTIIDEANGRHGTLYQNSIGLDQPFFEEKNRENGTHGTHSDKVQYLSADVSSDSLTNSTKIAKNTNNTILNINDKKMYQLIHLRKNT